MVGIRRTGVGLVVERMERMLFVVGCLFVLLGEGEAGRLLGGRCRVLKDRCVEDPFWVFVLRIDPTVGVCGEV